MCSRRGVILCGFSALGTFVCNHFDLGSWVEVNYECQLHARHSSRGWSIRSERDRPGPTLLQLTLKQPLIWPFCSPWIIIHSKAESYCGVLVESESFRHILLGSLLYSDEKVLNYTQGSAFVGAFEIPPNNKVDYFKKLSCLATL